MSVIQQSIYINKPKFDQRLAQSGKKGLQPNGMSKQKLFGWSFS